MDGRGLDTISQSHFHVEEWTDCSVTCVPWLRVLADNTVEHQDGGQRERERSVVPLPRLDIR